MSAFRTVKNGDHLLGGWDWLVVAALTIVVPAVIGGAVAVSTLPLSNKGLLPQAFEMPIAYFAGLMVAPFFTVMAVPVACLLGLWALRIGWAGWMMAVCVPVVLIAVAMFGVAHTNTGYLPSTYFEPALLFCFCGAVHGGVMWLALRWWRGAALAGR